MPTLTIDLTAADQTIGDGVIVTGFENVQSVSAAQLNFFGNTGANNVQGTSGNDTIDGKGGWDVLMGEGGADRIFYYGTEITIYGDFGSTAVPGYGDTLVLKAATTVNLATEDDQTPDDDVGIRNFTNVDASAVTAAVAITGRSDYASTLIGGSAADTLVAGSTGSTLVGRGGADTLTGGAGNDDFALYAGDFVAGETIGGGGGSDRLILRAGMDLSGAAAGAIAGIGAILLDTHDPLTNGNLLGAQTVTLRADQLSGVGQLSANALTGQTADTFEIKLAANGGLALAAIGFANVDANDRLMVTGTTGAESVLLNNAIRSVVDMGSGADTVLAGDGSVAHPRAYVSGSSVVGGAGNDHIDYGSGATTATLDGGADSDTLVGSFNDQSHVFDLSLAADQSSGDSVTVRNFENLDWSATNYAITATGDGGANIMIGGGAGGNVLNGGGGSDTLDPGGGAGLDTLTGGAGADTFRWQVDFVTLAPDLVTDFLSVDDTLAFAASAFTINGAAFDTLVNDTTGSANIRDADLVRYSAAPIDDVVQARNWVGGHPGQGALTGMGQFLALQNSGGDTVLYHYTGGDLNSLHAIATLDNVAPASVQLSDFIFI